MRSPKRQSVACRVERLEGRRLLSGGPRVTFSPLVDGGRVFQNFGGSFRLDRPIVPPTAADIRLSRVDGAPVSINTIINYAPGDLNLNVGFRADGFPTRIPVGEYELRLLSGPDHLRGVDGAALDGELPADGSFPTGDLEAGGDLVLRLSVDADTLVGLLPHKLIAWPLSDHEIELQWRGDTNYGYEIERATGDGEFELLRKINESGGGTHSYIDATAAPGEVYRYRVKSWGFHNDVAGVTGPSNEASSAVLPPNLYFPISALATEPGTRPDWLTDVEGTLFFTLSDGPHPTSWRDSAGSQLWATDGTPEGTRRVFNGAARDLVDFNGTLYFVGRDAEGGEEVWRSDGTVEGTVRVADVVPGASSASPRMLSVLGGSLLFAVPSAGQGYAIWKTDGTAAGTTRAAEPLIYLDEFPDSSRDYRRLFAVSGDAFYFRGATAAGADDAALYRFDPEPDADAPAVTQVAGAIDPSWLTDLNGELFFAGDVDLEHPRGRALHKVVPTQAATGPSGAQLITKANAYADGDYGWIGYLTRVGGALFFSGESEGRAIQLHYSDGTPEGTRVVPGVNYTGSSPEQYDFVDVGEGEAFFFGNDYPAALWKSDGTVAGTRPVRGYDFTYEFPTHSPAFLLPVPSGRVVYSDSRNLWYSDGSLRGSYQISPLGQEAPEGNGVFGFAGKAALVIGDRVFFSTKQADGSRELRVASLTAPAAPEGLAAAPVAATPLAAATQRPVQAVALAAFAPSAEGGIRLTWNDRSGNETGFVIERSARPDFATIGKVFYPPANATSMFDDSAAPDSASFYRIRAVNAGGASVASNTAAPLLAHVTGVFVSSSSWTESFKTRLEAERLGTAALGASLAAAGEDELPWSGLDTVTVQFDQDVRPILQLLHPPEELADAVTGFTYDDTTHTAVWTLRRGVLEGPIDYELDMESADGPAAYYLRVLAGDATRDGAVNALDLTSVRRRLNRSAGDTGEGPSAYHLFSDVNGDGRINALDLSAVRQRLNRRIPPPVEPSAGVRVASSERNRSLGEELFGSSPLLAPQGTLP